MEKNWVCIYSTDVDYRAELIKKILSDNGIQSVNINKKDSTYLFGMIEIYVERENAVRGKHILTSIDEKDMLES